MGSRALGKIRKLMSTLTPGATKCPACKADWDGGSILETFKKQRDEGTLKGTDDELEARMLESYSEPYRWSRKIGVEIQGKYDGVSYWKCPDCKVYFDRFTGRQMKEGEEL